MAAIEVGILRIREVFQGDLLDITFTIEGINLTGKTLKCQVRENADSDPVLTFEEDDDSVLSSLTKTIVSTTQTTLRMYKRADEMDIEPLPLVGRIRTKYLLTIIMFTDDSDIEDIETIIEGTMEVVPQVTII